MIARNRHHHEPVRHPGPDQWEYRVRMHDRTWLSRPERIEGETPGNALAFSNVIPDSWSFDDPASARRAALSHGAVDGAFRVIPAPRDPGAWLARSSPAALARIGAGPRAAGEAEES